LLGSLLNIKPILTIDDEGEVSSVDKVRGQKKAMARIIELLKDEYGQQELHVTVAHAKTPEAAAEFEQLLKENLVITKMDYSVVGPVIGTHAGPGTVAAFARPAR
jgi:DegV family protein with EDD domain